MSRRYRRTRRRSRDKETMLLVALLLAGTVKSSEAWFAGAVCILMTAIAAGFILYAYRTLTHVRRRAPLALLADVDVMDGLEFEEYVADLLRHHGYQNVHLTEPSDFGVDVIAEKAGERWGVQTKRYAGRVGDYSVKQVVTGLRYYHCSRAMVITNSTYTRRAETLGKSNGCILVDRNELAALIRDVSSQRGGERLQAA